MEALVRDYCKKEKIRYINDDDHYLLYSLTNEHFKGSLGDAINIYIIFRYIWDDNTEFTEKMRQLIEDNCNGDLSVQEFMEKIIFKVFSRIVGSIEIFDEDKYPSLLRVWFPILAVC